MLNKVLVILLFFLFSSLVYSDQDLLYEDINFLNDFSRVSPESLEGRVVDDFLGGKQKDFLGFRVYKDMSNYLIRTYSYPSVVSFSDGYICFSRAIDFIVFDKDKPKNRVFIKRDPNFFVYSEQLEIDKGCSFGDGAGLLVRGDPGVFNVKAVLDYFHSIEISGFCALKQLGNDVLLRSLSFFKSFETDRLDEVSIEFAVNQRMFFLSVGIDSSGDFHLDRCAPIIEQ